MAGKLPDFDNLWDYDHPDVTEGRLRELLPAALDSLDLSYLALLLTQIARAEGMQRKFVDALKTLDRVEKVLPKVDDRVKAGYFLEKGRILNSSGKADDARPLFLIAFDLASKSKLDVFAVDAARMIGVLEQESRRLEWSLKALAIAEASEDAKVKMLMGGLYNSIGWAYFDQGQYQEALFMLENALRFREEQGEPWSIRVARWGVGKVLRVMRHTEEALEMQMQLYQEYEAAGRRNGYVYEEVAECLLVMGRGEEAQPWFAAAYEELSRDPRVSGDQERMERLKELGGLARPHMQESQAGQ